MSYNIKSLFNLNTIFTEKELDNAYVIKINEIKSKRLCDIDKQILHNYYTNKYKEEKNTFIINNMAKTFSNIN
jgi:hypothetical protein